jgi:hypothetical protein
MSSLAALVQSMSASIRALQFQKNGRVYAGLDVADPTVETANQGICEAVNNGFD